jgi:hypothetical protein
MRRDEIRRRRQMAALRAYIETGSVKAAARKLGLTESGLRYRLATYCADNDTTLPAAIYELGRSGNYEISSPERGIAVSALT